MKIYHVGGLNPIRRTKTLKDALAKASDDDTIILHKSISEQVEITKNIIIQGNGHTIKVPQGKCSMRITSSCELHNIKFAVNTRSNAIVVEKNYQDVWLDKTETKLIGPVREFYPVILFKENNWKSGKILVENSKLLSTSSNPDTFVNFKDTTFMSYYRGDIYVADRSDMNSFYGTTTFDNCTLRSCLIAGNSTLNNCCFDRYIDFDNGAKIKIVNPIIDIHEDEVKRNAYKKEPSTGPLANKIDNKYAISFRNKIDVTIENLQVAGVRKDFLGIYADKSDLSINNTNLADKGLQHKVVDSTLSLHNTHDKNFWSLQGKVPTAYVRSDLNSNQQYETAMQKLNKLIGQDSVKEEITKIMNTQNQQQDTDNKDFEFSYHMIFVGDPGTGKTTIARIVAQALFEIGAIPKNKITFATSDEFVKGYIGQTGENTRRILDKALGGVLFIDEAYELTVRPGEKSFNSEVLSVLIRYMEDHRDDLVVIAAGYTKEMKEFLASNIGLDRRFNMVYFENYTPNQLAQIFELMRNSTNDKYADPSLAKYIEPLFKQLTEVNLSIPDANGRRTNGGNGGLVRNVYQSIILAKNNRLASGDPQQNITKVDIAQGFQAQLDKANARRM